MANEVQRAFDAMFEATEESLFTKTTAPTETTRAKVPPIPSVLEAFEESFGQPLAPVAPDEIQKQQEERHNQAFSTLNALAQIPQAALIDPITHAATSAPKAIDTFMAGMNAQTPEEQEIVKQRWRELQRESDHVSNRQGSVAVGLAAGGVTRVGTQALLNQTYGAIARKVGLSPLATPQGANVIGGTARLGIKTTVNVAEGSIGLGAFNAMWEEEDGSRPNILEGAAIGGGFGAAVALTPPTVRFIGAKIARPAVDGALWAVGKVPLPPPIKAFVPRDTRALLVGKETLVVEGSEVIRTAGAPQLADDLIAARDHAGRMSGGLTADNKKVFDVLTAEERKIAGGIAYEEISLRKVGGRFVDLEKVIPDVAKQREVIRAATQMRRQLRFIGEGLRVADVGVKDANNNLKWFEPATDFGMPHVFPNPRVWLGEAGRDITKAEAAVIHGKAIEAVLNPRLRTKLSLNDGTKVTTKEQAETWLEQHVARIEGEVDRGIAAVSHNSTTMFSRTIGLPGWERDPMLVLPQYNQWAAERLVYSSKFGPIRDGVPSIPTRWETISELRRKFLFGEGRTPASIRAATTAQRAQRTAEAKAAAEVRLAQQKRALGLKEGEELVQTAKERQAELLERGIPSAADPESNIRKLYPRAFDELEEINDLQQRALADKVLMDQLGSVPQASEFWRFANKVASMNINHMLTFSQILQPTQIMNSAAMTQYRGSFGMFLRAMRNEPEMWDFAHRAGVINYGIIRHQMEQLAASAKMARISGKRLDEIGFSKLDMVSRVVAATQGKMFAETSASRYAQLLNKPKLRLREVAQKEQLENKLRSIRIDPEEVAASGGRLTQQQLEEAGQFVSTEANFWSDALSLPHAYRTPQGRFFLQFKSFTQQQSSFVKKHLVKPWKDRGDTRPFIRWLVGTGLAGEVVADIKAVIFGRTERLKFKQPIVERAIENVANGAGLGIFFDAFLISSRGQNAAWGFVAGPTMGVLISDAVDKIGRPAGTSAAALVSGDIEKAIRDFEKAGRGAGRFAVRRVLPLYNRWFAFAAPQAEALLFPSKTRKSFIGELIRGEESTEEEKPRKESAEEEE